MAAINLAEPSGYRYLPHLSWCILDQVNECMVFDRDAEVNSDEEFVPLTKAQLNTPVLVADPCPICGCSPQIKLVLDVHRSGLASVTVELNGPNVMVGQVLRAIYKFYNLKKLTRTDYNKIRSMEPDIWGYRDEVLRAHAEGRSLECRWRDMLEAWCTLRGSLVQGGNQHLQHLSW
jgi:hypothetical protein